MNIREVLDRLDEISRRDFLKGAGAAAVGAAVGQSKDAQAFFGSSKCEKYASRFSCDYVEKEAPYDVLLWVPKWIAEALGIRGYDTGENYIEEYLGRTTGLHSVRRMAINRYRQILDMANRNIKGWSDSKYPWNERFYIGVLKGKKGENLEKHRLL